jgi:hypothetical protein
VNARLDHFLLYEIDGKRRLLLEAPCSYLYIWIGDDDRVVGFQFIGNDCLVIGRFADASLASGTITTEPFNRAILAECDPAAAEESLRMLLALECDELPDLLKGIQRMAQRTSREYRLGPQEAQLIGSLPHGKKYPTP